jgi:hypothetical protein|tara:strand:+ start:164 stop:433 length:270 start_codon:yes stop_codon:yes gene_type:complete
MKKIVVITLMFSLILITTIVKNSTKKFEDETFLIKENIRSLIKDYEKSKLEFDYLSSAEKLIEYQQLYFENKLVQKKIKEISSFELNHE